MARFTVGTSGTRTNNKFGAYALPANPGYVFITRLSLYVEGVATTIQRWSWQRMTGATVTADTAEKGLSRSATFAGTAARLESVNGTLVGNPYYLASAGQEALTPTRHRGFPRPQAVPQLIDGEQGSMSANVNTGVGVAYDNYVGFEDSPLDVGTRRLARRPRENGWFHRYEHVCERVAGTQIVASLRAPLVFRVQARGPGSRRSRAILNGGPTNATIQLTALATASAALVKQPQIVRSPQATASATIAKTPGRILTAALATATAVLTRTPGKTLTPSQATATATLTRQPQKRFTPLATASALVSRMAGHVFSPSATASATLQKTPAKTFSPSATASATLALIKVKTITLVTSVATASASLTRQPNRVMAPTATASAALSRIAGKLLTPGQATATATLRKTPAKTATPTPATATATLVRTPGKQLAAAPATATASISKTPARTLTPNVATATAQLRRVPIRTFAATAAASATLIRQPTKVLTAPATASAALAKRPAHTFTATASAIASLTKTAGRRLVTSPASAIASLVLFPFTHVGQWPPIATRLRAFRSGHGVTRFKGASGRTDSDGMDGSTSTDGDSGRTQL